MPAWISCVPKKGAIMHSVIDYAMRPAVNPTSERRERILWVVALGDAVVYHGSHEQCKEYIRHLRALKGLADEDNNAR